MNSDKVVLIKRENCAERKAQRLSRDIKTACYIEAIKKDKKERFFINQNKGVLQ